MKSHKPKSIKKILADYQTRTRLAWHWLVGDSAQPESSTEMPKDLSQDISKGTHFFLFILILLCLAFFLWAILGRLDVASQAMGEVFPSSQSKSIQHLEGGIVSSILVKEGEEVIPGQSLVTLESTASGADVEQLKIQTATLQLDISRLKSELNQFAPLVLNADLKSQHPELAKETEKLYKIRQQRHKAQIEGQQQLVKQKQAEVNEVAARLKNLKEALSLAEEKITISEQLLAEDLTNRYNHIELLQQANQLKSSIEEDQANLQRASSALKQEDANLSGLKHQHHETVTEQLEEAKRKLTELSQQMQKYVDNLKRTVITAPVKGVVKQLFVFTKGGVVKPGQTLLDIIPSGDQLIIDARLPVQDIGYIKVGQPASIRLASADGMRFDKLMGHVTFISPDTIASKNNASDTHETHANHEPYYKVRIVTNGDHFKGRGSKYRLYPGVQVSVHILTGSRSIMSYLLDPFLGAFHSALKER